MNKPTPVLELLEKLALPMHTRRAASRVLWEFPGPPFEARRQEARTRIIQAELEIEDIVRTWVYRELIKELKNTEEYKDPGHFDHAGVEFVLDYLKKNRPELGDENEG